MSGKITRIALWVLFFSFIAVGTAAAQTISLNVQDQPTGSATARIFNIILMITVLSIAPSILVMMTSFTRIIVVFSITRSALATNSTPPNMVLISLALFLTMFIMLGGIFLQAAFIYRISENNRLLAVNDLKYRYVKMCGKIGEKELMELETVFWDEQYRNLRDTVRNQVERYEEAVRRRAEQLEQASIKERKAKRLLDDVKRLRGE